jgi:hypothetical protein
MITAKKLAFATWFHFEAQEIEAAAAVLLGRAGLPAAPARAQEKNKWLQPCENSAFLRGTFMTPLPVNQISHHAGVSSYVA